MKGSGPSTSKICRVPWTAPQTAIYTGPLNEKVNDTWTNETDCR